MTTNIYLDYAAETTPKVMFAKQFDSDRTVVIYPLVGGSPMLWASGITAELHVRRADGTADTIACSVGRNNGEITITADLSVSSLSVPGMAVAECSIASDQKVLTSESFYINVREACADGGLR